MMQSMPSTRFTVDEMILIENHISAGDCPNFHPSLKYLAVDVGSSYANTPSSPLLMASYMGDLSVVQRMVEVWGADIEKPAFIFIPQFSESWKEYQGEGLLKVTPLFTAALNNQLEIVRYLVWKGADVSARTSPINPYPIGVLTPLHGTLLRYRKANEISDQLDIIRILLESGADPSALSSDGTPTWMFGCQSFYKNHIIFHVQGFCNVQAITLLIERGMNIEQRCAKLGKTLLHHMAGPGNRGNDETVVKLLLEKGADLQVRDKHGITPIMTAAIGTNLYPNMPILKFLMKRDDIPNMDKIQALEVATAVLLSYDRHFQMSSHPIRDINYCLSQAKNLRKLEGITLIPKTPSNGRAVEWITSSDFQDIHQWSLEHAMQSILIRLRIFSAMSWGAFYRYLYPYIDKEYICRKLVTLQNKHAQLLDISWALLETTRHFAPTTDKLEIFFVTVKAVETLVDTLSDLKRIGDPLFNVETLKTSFKLISSSFQHIFYGPVKYEGGIVRHQTTLREIISILAGLPDVTIQPIADYLSEIVVQNNEESYQQKLIFLACMEQTESTADIVRFLLKFGAVADAVDLYGNGPLHFLARANGEFTDSIARVLLDAGAHLDRINKEGSTAADIWMEERERGNKRRGREDQQPDGWRDLPDWLREDVPKLKCLSARVVRYRRISYKDVVPVTLHPFVAMH